MIRIILKQFIGNNQQVGWVYQTILLVQVLKCYKLTILLFIVNRYISNTQIYLMVTRQTKKSSLFFCVFFFLLLLLFLQLRNYQGCENIQQQPITSSQFILVFLICLGHNEQFVRDTNIYLSCLGMEPCLVLRPLPKIP